MNLIEFAWRTMEFANIVIHFDSNGMLDWMVRLEWSMHSQDSRISSHSKKNKSKKKKHGQLIIENYKSNWMFIQHKDNGIYVICTNNRLVQQCERNFPQFPQFRNVSFRWKKISNSNRKAQAKFVQQNATATTQAKWNKNDIINFQIANYERKTGRGRRVVILQSDG